MLPRRPSHPTQRRICPLRIHLLQGQTTALLRKNDDAAAPAHAVAQGRQRKSATRPSATNKRPHPTSAHEPWGARSPSTRKPAPT